jgi:uncharacterized protein YoxC
MSAADIGAIIGGAVGLVVAVVLIFAVLSLRRSVLALSATVDSVRQGAEEIRSQSLPLLGELRGIAARTEAELIRMDALLETVTSISATVDSASRLAYLAFSNPVIKALAFGSGTSRAVSRFRKRSED